eukprot:COSAG01_NODE_19_length_39011_cov_38.134968_8_plen_97_part_00
MGDVEARVYATDPSLGFSAEVPPGYETGHLMQVRTPSGHLVPLQIPPGKGPGEVVHVRAVWMLCFGFCQLWARFRTHACMHPFTDDDFVLLWHGAT